MPKVLIYEHVTGGGLAGLDLPDSWAVEGNAMRRALAREFASVPGIEVVMALDARMPDEPGPWTIVAVDDSCDLAEIASHFDHTLLIAPETDGVLADLAERIPRQIGSKPVAIELTGNKLLLAAEWIRKGIPTPASRMIRRTTSLPEEFIYPAVLKPIDGAGAIETFFIESHNDPKFREFSIDRGMLQTFVTGQARSASFLVRADGTAILLGVGLQNVVQSQGRFEYQGGTILNEPLPLDHPVRRAIAAVPGLIGWVGVDYIQSLNEQVSVLEINPRPTTSCVGLLAVLEPGKLAKAWLNPTSMILNAEDPWPMARPVEALSFVSDGRILR